MIGVRNASRQQADHPAPPERFGNTPEMRCIVKAPSVKTIPAKTPAPLRGVSLIELLIATFIGITVCGMVAGALQEMSRVSLRLQERNRAEEEARSLGEYLLSRVRLAGGLALRPHHALAVVNSTQGPDQLLIATPRSMNMSCSIVGVQETAGSFSVDIAIENSDGIDICCLTDAFASATVALLSNDDDGQAHWRYGIATNVDTTTCHLNLSDADVAPLEASPTDASVFVGGTLLAVVLQIFSVDELTHRLILSADGNGDGSRESTVIADRVLDLQVALGYDVPSWDWVIDDTSDTNDEWLYNAPGDVLGQDPDQRLGRAGRDDLRMAWIGVTIGVPLTHDESLASHQLLDGPTLSLRGWLTASSEGKVALRNLQIMR